MKGSIDEVNVGDLFTINNTGLIGPYGAPLDGTKVTAVSSEYVNATTALKRVRKVNGRLLMPVEVYAQRILRQGGKDTNKTQWTNAVSLYEENFVLFDDEPEAGLLEQMLDGKITCSVHKGSTIQECHAGGQHFVVEKNSPAIRAAIARALKAERKLALHKTNNYMTYSLTAEGDGCSEYSQA